MSAGEITALVTAIVALLGAVSTFLSQVSHLNWHKAQEQQPVAEVPPVTGGTPAP